IGAGWLEEEMRMFTPHFRYRFGFMREAVAAMRKLWTEDAPSFEGKWVRVPTAVCRPRPVQQPHPPGLIGGMGPNPLERGAARGAGWMPIGVAPDGLRDGRAELVQRARDAGRDASKLTFTVMTGAPPGLEEPMLDTIPGREVTEMYRDAGADRVVISVPTLGK